jgi:hypothetical protein
MSTHEQLISRRRTGNSSNRSFGIVFFVVFGLVGLGPLVSGAAVRYWALGTAILFLVAALVAPRLLTPLNWLWTKLGLALHHVVNPVIMALIYFGGVVPTGYVLRARNKDPLRLKREPEATTYWISRKPPAPSPGSMSKQF